MNSIINNENCLAVILVGGKGTRLRQVVSDRPKTLALVNGEPFINLLFKQLHDAGITEILLLTGYLHEHIVKACGDSTIYGQNIYYSREIDPLGTGGALANAENILHGWSEFLLLNGDTYFESSIRPVLDIKLNYDQVAVISAMYTNDCRRYGRLLFSENGLLDGFLEKENNINSGWVSNGICKLSNKILKFIPRGKFCSLEHDIFPKIIKEGYEITVAKLSGFFHDIGLPESYAYFNFKQVYNSICTDEIKVLFSALVLESKLWVLDKTMSADDFNNFSKLISLLNNRCNINYISDNNLISEVSFSDVLIISEKQFNKLKSDYKFKKLFKFNRVILIENIILSIIQEVNANWLKVLDNIEYLPTDQLHAKLCPAGGIMEEIL